MYIDEENVRYSTQTTEYGNNSKSREVANIVYYINRDATHTGNRVTPMPWFNNTCILRGSINYETYGKGLKRYQYVPQLGRKLVNQPYNPARSINFSQFNVSKTIIPGSSRVYHGNYGKSDLKALNKLNQEQLSLSVMLAEFTETVGYLASKASTVARFTQAIAWGKYHKSLEILGIARSKWSKGIGTSAAQRFLEWKFAILPTMLDISDVQKLLTNQLQNINDLYAFGKGSNTERIDHASPLRKSWGDLSPDWVRGIVKSNITSRTVTKFMGKVDDMELLVQKALGLSQAASAVYELVPFSWMVDYVVNFGDLLSAYNATKGVSFANGYQSTRVYGSSTYVEYVSNYAGSKPAAGDNYAQRQEITTVGTVNGYNRRILQTFPRPRVSFVLPDLSLGHAANVIALAISLAGYKVTPNAKL